MKNTTPITHLSDINACLSAIEWVKASNSRSLESAWQKCERGDWMLWYAGKKAGPVGDEKRKKLVLAACACARLGLPTFEKRYPGNDVMRVCLDTAEKWTRNKATLEALQVSRRNCYAAADAAAYDAYAAAYDACAAACAAAYDAAYDAAAAAYDAAACAACAAAYAAAAATKKKVLKECADIVRKWYPELPQ